VLETYFLFTNVNVLFLRNSAQCFVNFYAYFAPKGAFNDIKQCSNGHQVINKKIISPVKTRY
jgi:FPC/CPF motif-containing protein YcgG